MHMVNAFHHTRYFMKKQFLKLFGGSFRIYDETESLVLFASMKAFKLKEDIRLYTEESMVNEVLTIKARQIIDLWATYDIFDPATGELVGSFRRQFLKSMLKDHWHILDANGVEIGDIEEDNWLMAILRRFLTNLIPQTYTGTVRGQHVFTFKHRFAFFVLHTDLDFSPDTANMLDRRMGLAAAVLISAIEGRQES